MVGAAVAGGAGVARAGILIVARLRAVQRFQQFNRVLATSDNRILRLAGRVFGLAGALTILQKAVSLLMNPVTGLLALLEVGLATRKWLIYERSVRQATLQMRFMGLETGQITDRLNDLKSVLGATAAGELFRNTRAILALMNVTEGWRLAIAEMGAIMRIQFDPEVAERFMTAAGEAANGSIEALQDIQDMFPALQLAGKTFEETMSEINRFLREMDVSNMEQVAITMGEIQDRISGPIGAISDFFANIPKWGAEILQFFVEGAFNIGQSIVDVFGILKDNILAFIREVPDLIIGLFTGDTERIRNAAAALGRQLVENIIFSFTRLLDMFDNTFLEGASNIINRFVTNTIIMFTGWIADVINLVISLVPKFSTILDVIGRNIATVFMNIFGVGGRIARIIGTFLSSVWKVFWDSEPIKAVKDFISTALSAISTFFTVSIPNTARMLAGIIGRIMKTTLVDPIIAAINSVISFINTNLIDNINRISIPNPFGDDIGFNIPPIPTIPNFAHGGVVPGPIGKPRLVVAHGGEEFLGTNGQQGAPKVIHIYIGNKKVDTVILDSMSRIVRRSNLVPRALNSA